MAAPMVALAMRVGGGTLHISCDHVNVNTWPLHRCLTTDEVQGDGAVQVMDAGRGEGILPGCAQLITDTDAGSFGSAVHSTVAKCAAVLSTAGRSQTGGGQCFTRHHK